MKCSGVIPNSISLSQKQLKLLLKNNVFSWNGSYSRVYDPHHPDTLLKHVFKIYFLAWSKFFQSSSFQTWQPTILLQFLWLLYFVILVTDILIWILTYILLWFTNFRGNKYKLFSEQYVKAISKSIINKSSILHSLIVAQRKNSFEESGDESIVQDNANGHV